MTLSVSNCLGCGFCPQDKLGAAYKDPKRVMAVEDFHTILGKIPAGTQIHYSGFSEPFLNPNACRMIEAAYATGRPVHLYTTLVGMKPCCVAVLKSIQPAVVRIHVPDGKALVLPEERWVETHEQFLETRVKATYMAMNSPSDFIKRHLAIKNIMLELPEMINRGGNLSNVPSKDIRGPMRCTMNRWHSNVVLPNGDVFGCCQDYALTVRLGNLIEQPYSDIFSEGEKWRMNMEHKAEGICSKCTWATPV